MADTGNRGFDVPSSSQDDYNAQHFMIHQILTTVRTSQLVVVKSVSNDGGVTAVGTVSIQPLVGGVDGFGNVVAHGTIFDVPYLRVQGGANAIILDPQVGDIGIALFADRDLSTVKSTKAAGAPGSNRKHDMADALYIGGLLNGLPSQYVQFNDDGIAVVSPTKVSVTAPTIEMTASTSLSLNSPEIALNGAVTQGSGSYSGAAVFTNTVTASEVKTASGIALGGHAHDGVQTGSGTSGGPVST